MAYDIGDRITILATFATSSGAYVDPTDVAIRVEKPRSIGTTASTNPTRLSIGRYIFQFTSTTYGRYTYLAVGTGAYVGAAEGALAVRPRQTT